MLDKVIEISFIVIIRKSQLMFKKSQTKLIFANFNM